MKYRLTKAQAVKILSIIKEETLKSSGLNFLILKEDRELEKVEMMIDEIEDELELISNRLMEHEDVKQLVIKEENLIKGNIMKCFLTLPFVSFLSHVIAGRFLGANQVLVISAALSTTVVAFVIKTVSEKIRLNHHKWDVSDKHDLLFEQIREINGKRNRAYDVLTQVEKRLNQLHSEKYQIDYRLEKLHAIKNTFLIYGGEPLMEIDSEIRKTLEELKEDPSMEHKVYERKKRK